MKSWVSLNGFSFLTVIFSLVGVTSSVNGGSPLVAGDISANDSLPKVTPEQSSPPAGNNAAANADVVGGHPSTYIIVRCTPQMADPTVAATHAFGQLCAHWRVSKVRPAFEVGFADAVTATQLGLDRMFVLEVPANTDTPKMVQDFRQLAQEVEVAEVDGIGEVAGFIPNDSSFDLQWYMHNIGQEGGTVDADVDGPGAWAITTGVEHTVTIAIVDSGVTPHVEFSNRMVPGINTNNPNMPNLTTDGCPHGTHVAGLAAAMGNNVVGIAGMNWGAYIMPVRVLNGCTGTEVQCANGIMWAADNGADVINLSVQYYTGTTALMNAVQYAHQQGVLLVAAAGNFQPGVVAFPARFQNCMAISATTRFDTFASFSNWGNEVDMSAPGDDIWSTWTNNNYWPLEGTSMATPLVAGTASLIRSLEPDLSNGEIVGILTSTSDDRGPAGWDNHFGHGRLNAAAALGSINTAISIISSIPATETIDARQPSNLDGSEPTGIQMITLRFSSSTNNLAIEDLVLTQEGGAGSAPTVAMLETLLPDTVNVILSAPISVGGWTTLTHLPSETSVRLGYLPGDVNGDRTSSPLDILALLDYLNEVGPVLSLSSIDIDRSDLADGLDVLREIDLLNGAEMFDVFNGAMLP